MVGCNGVATASVAYHEALEYARVRPQGRSPGAKDPAAPIEQESRNGLFDRMESAARLSAAHG